MKASDFFVLPEEHSISSEEAAELNADLAEKFVDDFPAERRDMVSEYLTAALNMNSIEPSLRSKLEHLLFLLTKP